MPTNDASAPSIAATPLQTVPRRSAPLSLSRLGDKIEAWLEAERDQLPLWLPVALGFGIAAWFVLPSSSAWTAFLLNIGRRRARRPCCTRHPLEPRASPFLCRRQHRLRAHLEQS